MDGYVEKLCIKKTKTTGPTLGLREHNTTRPSGQIIWHTGIASAQVVLHKGHREQDAAYTALTATEHEHNISSGLTDNGSS